MVMCHKGEGNAAGTGYAIVIGAFFLAVGVIGGVVTGEWMPLLCGAGFLLALGIVCLLISLFWLLALWPLLRLTASLAEKIARRQKTDAGTVKRDL